MIVLFYLESVPKAVAIAVPTPFKYMYGFRRVKKQKIAGKTISPCTAIPRMTVTIKSANPENVLCMSFISAKRAMIKLPMPIGEYLKRKQFFSYNSANFNDNMQTHEITCIFFGFCDTSCLKALELVFFTNGIAIFIQQLYVGLG